MGPCHSQTSKHLARLLAFSIAICATQMGCSPWHQPESVTRSNRLPTGRMELDSIALEVAVAELDEDQEADFERFWSLLDQQKISLPTRRLADRNGFRVAVLSSQLPAELQRLLAPRKPNFDKLDSWQRQLFEKGRLPNSERLVAHQRIQNRDGQTHTIFTSTVQPEKSWIIETENGVTPGAAKSVTGGFDIKTFHNSDGSVRLAVTPLIQYGQTKSRIGVIDQTFLIEAAQEINRLNELTTEVELLSGESLILAPIANTKELGELLFAATGKEDPAFGKPEHRILMVRIVQTQADDLFQSDRRIERLTSIPDM